MHISWRRYLLQVRILVFSWRADDIDDVGVMFDRRFDVDPIDDGDVDDEIDTAGFPSGKYTPQPSINLPA